MTSRTWIWSHWKPSWKGWTVTSKVSSLMMPFILLNDSDCLRSMYLELRNCAALFVHRKWPCLQCVLLGKLLSAMLSDTWSKPAALCTVVCWISRLLTATCVKSNVGIWDIRCWLLQALDILLLLLMARVFKELSGVGIAGSEDAMDHDELWQELRGLLYAVHAAIISNDT